MSTKTTARLGLVSLDIGGTVGFTQGRTIATILAAASALPATNIRRVLRSTLYIAPVVTDSLIENVCAGLGIDRTSFPSNYVSPPFRFHSEARAAIESISTCVPIVTLSNVCCLDHRAGTLENSFGSCVSAHYASCVLGSAKPDPQAFEAVATRHGIALSSLVHVGDDWECDILGAIAVGARAIWISRGRSVPSDGLSVDLGRLTVANDLAEAAECVCASTAECADAMDQMACHLKKDK